MGRLRNILGAFTIFVASTPAAAGEIVVSAATSLAEVFKELGRGYEARSPGATVVLNTAASGALLQQLANGAPVDVLATADRETIEKAAAQELVAASGYQDFARNELVVVVGKDAARLPAGLSDLQGPAIRRVAIGNPDSVPVGRYAQTALVQAAVWDALAPKLIYAASARQVLDYVARGEVDAGFVYATDAVSAGDRVRRVFTAPPPGEIRFPIAVTSRGARGADGARFVAFVVSSEGQAILRRHGFLAP